ncbi:MAG: molybdenum cofactor guanylyltransferase [Tepidiformaceae bacterium]
MRQPTGIVLAGGQSTRFGRDKASALLQGRTLLDWVVSAIAPAVGSIVVSTSRGQSLPPLPPLDVPLRIIEDEMRAVGPLAALTAALATAPPGAFCFVASCDVPLLTTPLVGLLLSIASAGAYDAIVPVVAGRSQPLVAVYDRERCFRDFRSALAAGEGALAGGLAGLSVLEVPEGALRTADPDLRSFLNVNRPEDLATAAALMAGTPPPRAPTNSWS